MKKYSISRVGCVEKNDMVDAIVNSVSYEKCLALGCCVVWAFSSLFETNLTSPHHLTAGHGRDKRQARFAATSDA